MADDASQVGVAYLNVIPKLADNSAADITKQATGGLSEAAEAAGQGFGSKMLAGMKGPLLGAGAVLGGVMGLGKIAGDLMGIGQTFDEMTDTIIIGTGASGEALESLKNSAKDIATSVPIPFEEAGDIVQNLNTRMGLVGDDLAAVGERVAAAGQLMGQNINLDSLTGAFNAFGIANEDAAAKMDYLFNVGQATGIGFDQLTGIIEKNAPALQNLGFSFEESANMAGLLDKAGMDAGGTMGKMAKALSELAEPGQSAADAYRTVIGEMEGYIEAGDTASAIDIAGKVFGTKGAAQFVGAIQSGALSLDEISNAALGAGDGIMGTMEATMDWPERWELLKNKATEALEPIGGALMDGASKAMEKFTEALDNVDPTFFDQLAEGVAGFIEGGAQLLIDGIQWVIDNKDSIAEGITGFIEGVQGAIDVISNIADVIGTTFTVAGEVLGSVFALMSGDADGAAQGIANAANIIGEKLGFPGLGDNVMGIFDNIQKFMEDPVGTAMGAIQGFAEDIMDFLGFGGLVDTVSGIFTDIQKFMEDPVGNAARAIDGFISDILGSFNFQWSLPELRLPHIVVGEYIDVPVLGTIPNPATLRVEWYAQGGIFNAASIIGVGEAGPEAVLPIEKLVPLLSEALKKIFAQGKPGDMLSGIVAAWADGVKEAASKPLMGIPGTFHDAMDNVNIDAINSVTAFRNTMSNMRTGVEDAMTGVAQAFKNGLYGLQYIATEDVMNMVIIPAHNTFQALVQSWALAMVDMTRVAVPQFDGVGWYNVPSVPGLEGYAQGGFVQADAVFRAGERGGELIWPSYEPYLSKYANALSSRIGGGGGVDIHDCTFNVRNDNDIRLVAQELNTLINRQRSGAFA